ncbi:MAG: response regulator [Thermoanaerobaculia bacterium]|nr:response regulator [Thermoanaerobaculia bacterium]
MNGSVGERTDPPDPETSASLELLVVDDDEQILELLERYLSGLGCRVATAGEMEEAVALLENRRYDVVITDLGLTRFGRAEGVDVVTRARYRWPDLRIIVLTGIPDPQIREACFEAGADVFMRKPPSLPELAEAVFAVDRPAS